MRRFVAALLLFGATSASGQTPAPPTPSPASDAAPVAEPAATLEGGASDAAAAPPAGTDEVARSISDRANERWFELRELLAAPNAATLGKLDEIRKMREKTMVRGFPSIARALTVEGFRALDSGDHEIAAERFHAALDLDPSGSDARLGLAAAARKKGLLSGGYAAEIGRAFRLRLATLRSSPFALSNLALLLAAGLVGAGILAILALTVRTQSLVRHDVQEWLKHRTSPELAAALSWVVLLLPLLLTFDLYWAALFWAVAIAAYLSAKELVVLVVSLVCIATALPALGFSARILAGVAEPQTRAAAAYLEGVVDAPMLHDLEGYVAAKPQDTDAKILLALVYEQNGQPRKAIASYRKLAETEKSPGIFNNIANIYYRLEEKDKAFEYWKKALDTDPGFAPALYNLSLYYFDFFEFQKKDEYFNKAKSIDPSGVDRWVRAAGVVDFGVPRERVQKRIWSGAAAAEGPGGDPLIAAVRSPQVIGAGVALVLGLALAKKRKEAGVASSCLKCGEAFCGDCRPGTDRNDYCLQCVHLFVRKDGVSPQMRTEKIKEIERNQTIRFLTSIVLGLAAPGAGQVFRSRTGLGFLLLLGWAIGLAFYLLGGCIVLEPGFVSRAAAVIPFSAGLALAGLCWLAGNGLNLSRKD